MNVNESNHWKEYGSAKFKWRAADLEIPKAFADAFKMAFEIRKSKKQMTKKHFQTVILKDSINRLDLTPDFTTTTAEQAMLIV